MEYLTLNNGRKMPVLGLGLFLATNPGELESALNEALRIGYRHFDTAYLYQNEAILGKVLKEWIESGKVTRDELFITTKLPFVGNTPEKVGYFIDKSLSSLQLDYVDLYLIHCPVGVKYTSDSNIFSKNEAGEVQWDFSTDILAVWRAMERVKIDGKALAVGVSNFTVEQLERVIKNSKIIPANNQVEAYAYFQQRELREFCKMYDIKICGYGPLGSPGRSDFYKKQSGVDFVPPAVLSDPEILKISSKYGKTPAQILIKFVIQLGLITIPKSTTLTRLKENFDVFDFTINDSDMKELEKLDKGPQGRSFDMSIFKGAEKHPEFPFK